MRRILRVLFVFVTAAVATAGFSGCSDAFIANRDDQHTPSVPPAKWENNPLGMPSSPNGRAY